MVLLLGLGGEIVYEIIKFIIMLILVVCAFIIGKKLREHTDAKKAAKLDIEKTEAQKTEVHNTEAAEKEN